MLALPLAPSTTLLLFTGSLLFIYLEFNRPGLIVPGCIGLVGLLTAAASLSAGPHPAATLVLLTFALLLFAAATRFPSLFVVLAGGTSLLSCFLLATSLKTPATLVLAAICAAILTGLTHSLATIAHRARANKTHSKTHKKTLHHLD